MPRAVYARGASSIRYFTPVALRAGHPVRRRAQPVARTLPLPPARRHHRPGAAHQARARPSCEPIAAGGNDELGLLADTINAGFPQLEATRTQQEVQAKNLSSTLAGAQRPPPGPQEVPHPPAATAARERLARRQPGDQRRAGPAGGRGPGHLRSRRDLAAQAAAQPGPARGPGRLLQAEARLRATSAPVRMRTPRRGASRAGQHPAQERLPRLRRHLHRSGERHEQGRAAQALRRRPARPRRLRIAGPRAPRRRRFRPGPGHLGLGDRAGEFHGRQAVHHPALRRAAGPGAQEHPPGGGDQGPGRGRLAQRPLQPPPGAGAARDGDQARPALRGPLLGDDRRHRQLQALQRHLRAPARRRDHQAGGLPAHAARPYFGLRGPFRRRRVPPHPPGGLPGRRQEGGRLHARLPGHARRTSPPTAPASRCA